MSARAAKRFAQVYPKGWHTLRAISENAMALKVYSFIAEHCDHLNALVCPVEVMADEFAVHERTVRRALKWLEDEEHLTIVKIGTANAYILDPADIWKNYERYKGYCAFHANTLASKRQNKLLKTRLTHLIEGGEKQPADGKGAVKEEGEPTLFPAPEAGGMPEVRSPRKRKSPSPAR